MGVSECVCIFRYVSFALIGPPVFGLLSTVFLGFGGNILILLSSGCMRVLPGGFYSTDSSFLTESEKSVVFAEGGKIIFKIVQWEI